jgi:hypothetical protein
MGRIRPLGREDVPAVARLHRAAFRTRKPLDRLEAFFDAILFGHPWQDDELPSLACEDGSGRLVGCVGVMPRPMLMDGRRLRAAVTHHFMVDGSSGSSLAAAQLAAALFKGPQDLSLANGNPKSRLIVERMGGTVLPAPSLRWVRVLRPVQAAMVFARRRGVRRGLARALGPVERMADALVTRFAGTLFRPAPPPATSRDLTLAELLRLLDQFTQDFRLRPHYDEASLGWLLATAGSAWREQVLRKVVVVDRSERPAGWYLYYARPGSVGHVLQMGAREDARDDVLRHLFHDAWRERVVALTGQLELRWMEALSRHHCVFDQGGHWLMAHTRCRDLLHALLGERAFLSKLEGEGWIQLAI